MAKWMGRLARRSSLQGSFLSDFSKHFIETESSLLDQSSRIAPSFFASTSLHTSTTHQDNDHHDHPSPTTVNKAEAKKFAKLAGEWWDLKGSFAALHQLNPTRVSFIQSSICDNFGLDPSATNPLSGVNVVDVGCGGGILSEALARLGANVHGIDVNEQGIAAAEEHASIDPSLSNNLKYSTTQLESLVAEEKQYDAVIASEVIEHVASVPVFCSALVQATKPGGAIIISTLNRTVKSYALAIVAAEHVLQWAHPGTHDWNKFITETELVLAMQDAAKAAAVEVKLEQIAGMIYDPLKREWGLGRDLGINYIAYFRKSSV